MKSVFKFLRDYAEAADTMNLSTSSAALCYYFTMTFFPLVICLYSLLGSSFDTALRLMRFAGGLLPGDALAIMEEFLNHVASGNSRSMLAAGLIVLISVASAAIRSVQTTIGKAQGGLRFRGLMYVLFSLVASVAFLAAIYFAMLVMLTGKEFISLVNRFVPSMDLGRSWQYLRYPALGGIYLVIVLGIYKMPMRREDSYSVLPGALCCTAAIVADSMLFSRFIAGSIRYPLVYGSLASVILLMIWLYSCCMVFYAGAALNICLRQRKREIDKGVKC